MRHHLLLGVAAVALIAPAAVSAQETTSAISGQVTNESGAPLAGARITVVHTPSGTTATSASDGTGTFSLRGLRVGGPYTVTVDAPGYPEQVIDNIALTVGDTLGLPITLNQKDIIVTGNRTGRQLIEGSQSTFNAAQIQDIVSARRDVRDIIRRDPLAAFNPNVGGVTIAGGNIRTQRFSVDGVQIQDSFGLNYGGLPSTRGIVSLEAIDQLSVKAAPFDVSEGNFQGGAVNVVLKSGTNKYHLTGFGNFGGPSLTGNKTRDNRVLGSPDRAVNPTTVLDFTNYGGSISGPIVKDKLFFFGAYESLSEGAANTAGVTGSNAANIVPNLTQAQVDNVISRFGTAGYNPYNIGTIPASIAEEDRKYSAKVDWNITSGQRLSVSWIHHENTLPNYASGGGTLTGSTSPTTPYIQLQSNQYKLTEFTNAYAAQLNSQWNDNISSEIRVSKKYYRRGQEAYFGPDYAQFNVCTDAGPTPDLVYPNADATRCDAVAGNANGIVRLGPDGARQANKFYSKQLTITTNLQWKYGDHTIKLEADHVNNQLYNLFSFGGGSSASGLTGSASGSYYFDSLNSFSNRTANEFTLTEPVSGNKNDAYVKWNYNVNTFGIQDTWRPSPKFTANLGARVDFYDGDRVPVNQNFLNRYSPLYPGITNTGSYNGRLKVQPRFGFNWSGIRDVRISGGAGLFAGGLSDVSISNNFSNSGVAINNIGTTLATIDILRNGGTAAAPTCVNAAVSTSAQLPAALCAAALTAIPGGTIPTLVTNYIATLSSSPTATTNSLDPNFKIPAQWKYNLAANWRPHFGDSLLASGWNFRADVLYSKVQQGIRFIDLRSQPLVVGGVVQVTPDGRPRYGAFVGGVAPGTNSDAQLTNTDKGRAWIFAVAVEKELGPLHLSGSYTHQNVKDISGALISSTVGSSGSIPTSDSNSGGDYARSAFEVTHTIRANIDFKHAFFGDNQTRFGINWELRSGQPFSVTMNDSTTASAANAACPIASGRSCIFGSSLNTANLFYVPNFGLTPSTTASTTQGVAGGLTQYGNVIFADAATLASVQNLVNSTDLKNFQGKTAPRNALEGPYYNKVDLNFAQQLPFFFHSKITALFSIENFLNLVDRNWGTYQDYGTSATVVRVACQTPAAGSAQTCPNYVYSTFSAPVTQSYSKPSLYTIRAGVRFDF